MATKKVGAAHNRHVATAGKTKTAVQTAAAASAAKAVAAAAKLTPDKVVTDLASKKVELAAFLDKVSAQVSSQVVELKEVEAAIVTKRAELQDLYDIEVAANTLEALIAAQEQEKSDHIMYMEEAKAKRFEEDQELTTRRQREREEYEYRVAKERRDAKEKFEAELKAQREAQERVLLEREDDLLDREADFQARVEGLNQQLLQQAAQLEDAKKEKDAAVAIATNSVKKDLQNQFAIDKLQLENRAVLLQSELTMMQKQIAALTAENEKLKAETAKATGMVQAIAEKAIDGASKQAVNINTADLATSAGRGRVS